MSDSSLPTNQKMIGSRLFNVYTGERTSKADRCEIFGQIYIYCLNKALGKKVHLKQGKLCDVKTAHVALRILFGIIALSLLPFTLLGVLLTALSKSQKNAHLAAIDSLKVNSAISQNNPSKTDVKSPGDKTAQNQKQQKIPSKSQEQTPPKKVAPPTEKSNTQSIYPFTDLDHLHDILIPNFTEVTEEAKKSHEQCAQLIKESNLIKKEGQKLSPAKMTAWENLTQKLNEIKKKFDLKLAAIKNQMTSQLASYEATLNSDQKQAMEMSKNLVASLDRDYLPQVKEIQDYTSSARTLCDQEMVPPLQPQDNPIPVAPPPFTPPKKMPPCNLENVKAFIKENPDELKPSLLIYFLSFKEQNNSLTKSIFQSDQEIIAVCCYIIDEFAQKKISFIGDNYNENDALALAIKRDYTDNRVITKKLLDVMGFEGEEFLKPYQDLAEQISKVHSKKIFLQTSPPNLDKANPSIQVEPNQPPKKIEIIPPCNLINIKAFIKVNPTELKPSLLIHFLNSKDTPAKKIFPKDADIIEVCNYLIDELNQKGISLIGNEYNENDVLAVAIQRDYTTDYKIVKKLLEIIKKSGISLTPYQTLAKKGKSDRAKEIFSEK